MDKIFIINEIKLYLNIKTDSEFAEFLGVKQPTISTWRKRNTIDYDLIISKCNNINGHWLLTGKGSMLKEDTSKPVNTPEDMGQMALLQQENAFLKEKIMLLEENKTLQTKEIKHLEEEIKRIKSKI